MNSLNYRVRFLLSTGVLIFMLVFFTAFLDLFHYQLLPGRNIGQKDIFLRMFGDGRKIFSQVSYIKVNEYLHGGASMLSLNADHEQGKKKDLSAPAWNVLLYLREKIMIREHTHIPLEQQKEMLPWFYYAVKLDCHNAHAYAVGGYWLAEALNKPGQALLFLAEGISNNPRSWDLYSQQGYVYMKLKDYDQAIESYEQAFNLLPDNASSSDRRKVYTLFAFCLRQKGDFRRAFDLYQELAILFPEDKKIKQVLSDLENEIAIKNTN